MGYGRKNPNRRLTEEDSARIDFGVFDLNDLHQLQELILIGMSGLMGFRGSQEHTDLRVEQIVSGTFPSNHPLFPNIEWWGISHMNKDKTSRLNLSTNHVRDTEGVFCRFPVLQDQPDKNFGGALKRYRNLIPHSKKTTRAHRRISKDGTRYLSDSPIGKTKIRSIFKSGLARMGIENESVFPHALRAWFTTTLANDPSVSATETMNAARHSSVEASAIYQSSSSTSESNRLRALLRIEDNDNQEKSPIQATPTNPHRDMNQIVEFEDNSNEIESNENNYSVYTQYQVDELYNEINRLESTSNGTIEIPRRRSLREQEIFNLRRRVQEAERQLRMSSYPYNSPEEESESLYEDSLEEHARYERNYRIRRKIERRRRIKCRRVFWGNL